MTQLNMKIIPSPSESKVLNSKLINKANTSKNEIIVELIRNLDLKFNWVNSK